MSNAVTVQKKRRHLAAAILPLTALALIAAGCASVHWGLAVGVPGMLIWIALMRQPKAPKGEGDD